MNVRCKSLLYAREVDGEWLGDDRMGGGGRLRSEICLSFFFFVMHGKCVFDSQKWKIEKPGHLF